MSKHLADLMTSPDFSVIFWPTQLAAAGINKTMPLKILKNLAAAAAAVLVCTISMDGTGGIYIPCPPLLNPRPYPALLLYL